MKWIGFCIVHALAFSMEFGGGFGHNNFLLNHDLTSEEHYIYKQLETCFGHFEKTPKLCQIPKKLHFVWLGPLEPHLQHQNNIISWIEKHPEWHITLWTDQSIDTFHPHLHIKRFNSHDCGSLKENYLQTQNFSERANLAAYIVLVNDGGVYVDCDVECVQAIDTLADQCDFFCPAQHNENTALSSSLFASKSVMGATPHHPILMQTLQRIQSKWERITQSFNSHHAESAQYLAKYRCLWPLTEAIINRNTSHTVIFPPVFFSTVSKEARGIYACDHRLPLFKANMFQLTQSIIKKSKNIIKKHHQFQFFLTLFLSILALIQILVLLSLYRTYAFRFRR